MTCSKIGNHMAPSKSLDEITLIAALLYDVHTSHGEVFNTRACRNSIRNVRARYASEGLGFLTKTLPRLGKALDRALSSNDPFSATGIRFRTLPDSELPRFLGEFWKRIFDSSGMVLPDSCAESVRVLRQVLYLFYKYKLPYTDEQEQNIIDRFEKTEDEISTHSDLLRTRCSTEAPSGNYSTYRRRNKIAKSVVEVAREARYLLSDVFAFFDPTDICPSHGPGAVSTGERLSGKYVWTNVPRRITTMYPFDAYFCASIGAVCDNYQHFPNVDDGESSAKVILVPKDSRGPRLISCEPLAFQWIQQGLGRAIVRHVEAYFNEDRPGRHKQVNFTDQQPNQVGALLGSQSGKYATLDLNEASDRVSVDLVRLLFPEHLLCYLEACRSLSTRLPSGKILTLRKFAPMGSALCFPILALTVWSILTAAAPDADTRDRILVYGDDVVVPAAFAANAIEQLEAFGLKINRDKSCTSGLFRESCGMDAYKGECVTPVRLRTVWSSHPSADVYTSWIEYANSFYRRKHFTVYYLIVEALGRIYRELPTKDLHLGVPSLEEVPDPYRVKRSRFHHGLQKRQWKVWALKPARVSHEIDGWSMLLRYFSEGQRHTMNGRNALSQDEAFLPSRRGIFADCGGSDFDLLEGPESFSVREYTKRCTGLLVRRWR